MIWFTAPFYVMAWMMKWLFFGPFILIGRMLGGRR